MLLTEATENAATKPLLETWSGNERMRHVPPLDRIVHTLDVTLRRRVEELYSAFATLPPDHPRRAAIEEQLRCVCRAVDRLADAARHTRPNPAPTALGDRVHWAIQHAVSSLTSLDPNVFGRRYPMQTHERSKAETIVGCLVAVLCQVERLATLVREVDRGIDERLLAGLVVLNEPLRQQPMA